MSYQSNYRASQNAKYKKGWSHGKVPVRAPPKHDPLRQAFLYSASSTAKSEFIWTSQMNPYDWISAKHRLVAEFQAINGWTEVVDPATAYHAADEAAGAVERWDEYRFRPFVDHGDRNLSEEVDHKMADIRSQINAEADAEIDRINTPHTFHGGVLGSVQAQVNAALATNAANRAERLGEVERSRSALLRQTMDEKKMNDADKRYFEEKMEKVSQVFVKRIEPDILTRDTEIRGLFQAKEFRKLFAILDRRNQPGANSHRMAASVTTALSGWVFDTKFPVESHLRFAESMFEQYHQCTNTEIPEPLKVEYVENAFLNPASMCEGGIKRQMEIDRGIAKHEDYLSLKDAILRVTALRRTEGFIPNVENQAVIAEAHASMIDKFGDKKGGKNKYTTSGAGWAKKGDKSGAKRQGDDKPTYGTCPHCGRKNSWHKPEDCYRCPQGVNDEKKEEVTVANKFRSSMKK